MTRPFDLTPPELVDLLSHTSVPKYLSPSQAEALQRSALYRANGPTCPVCLDEGWYTYLGKRYDCPDDSFGHVALRLAQWYWIHNIPLQYQQLDFNDWPVDDPEYKSIKDDIDIYLELFPRYRVNGVGMTFYSEVTATGKTWAATAVLKELVKQGWDGWFASFLDIKGYYSMTDTDEKDFLIRRLQESQVLVLDEIKKPWTEPMREFFATTLEELIRPRTNANLPTIITTNLTPEQMEEHFPRVFSLMAAKNNVVELPGKDYRIGAKIWKRNTEIRANSEALPIT